MNIIIGIYYRNSSQLPAFMIKKMKSAMVTCETTNLSLWADEDIGMGQSFNIKLSTEKPNSGKSRAYTSTSFNFVAAGRLDNTKELYNLLQVPESQRSTLTDSELMLRAYDKWGEACSAHMYGDWAFAAWHPLERRIILSRDHHGNTPLYYYIDHNVFAFATSRQILLNFNLIPIELNELYLAQYLVSWPEYHGEHTLHKHIQRLPPAHSITITKSTHNTNRYWFLENTPEIRLSRREDYADAFRPIFDEAVRCRLRSSGLVGSTLSGGLDSSSVAVTAAKLLKENGQRLEAFTSVPYFENCSQQQNRFEDEYSYALASATYSGNINLHSLNSITISPITAIRRVLQLNCDPCHGAANLFWLADMYQTARKLGCDVLLTGQGGNGGISWTGDFFSQPWKTIVSHMAWSKFKLALKKRCKEKIKSLLPFELHATIRQSRINKNDWLRETAIHPDFARRIQLLEYRLQKSADQRTNSPRDTQYRIIMPGQYAGGAYDAELGAAHGLEIRDPTIDARVLAFACSVPDHIFIDPKTGLDRWLIRETMKGRLPDEVRLNRKRGRQAADLVPRLRECASEIEGALDELRHGPAAYYIDVDHMLRVWHIIKTKDTHESFIKSMTILTRGIMAGLFVNQFYE